MLAPDSRRWANLMVDCGWQREQARERLRAMDAELALTRKLRFGQSSSRPQSFDLVLNADTLMGEQMANVVESAARGKGLAEAALLSAAAEAQVQFEVRLKLARYGVVLPERVAVERKEFGHPSEEVFANLLDFYRIAWHYEPRSFALQWDKDGKVLEAFTPDFYLPEFDLYVELTTMKQAHVTQEEPQDPAAACDLSPRQHPDLLSEGRAGPGHEIRAAGAPGPMNGPPIERILFTEEQIEQRIREVAAEIALDYAGRQVKLIGVLKGSVFFLTALARELAVPSKIDFLAISSFANQGGGPGTVRIAKDLEDSIEGENVILVEDIVDTGFTARYLVQNLAGRAPRSLAICTLLDRTSRRIVQVPVNYRCFEIPDRFVVGFRAGLPAAVPRPEIYRGIGRGVTRPRVLAAPAWGRLLIAFPNPMRKTWTALSASSAWGAPWGSAWRRTRRKIPELGDRRRFYLSRCR